MTRRAGFAILACALIPALAACSPAVDEAVPSVPSAAGARPVDGHNSQNSLDWAGTYEGILPCTDCPGLETRLTLNRDGSFERSTRRQPGPDAPRVVRGTFSWNADGGSIALDASGDGQQFSVGEGRVSLLDRDNPRGVSLQNRTLLLVSAGTPTPVKDMGQTLEAHRWKLESATDARGDAVQTLSPGLVRAVVFSFSGGRLAIQGSCNRLTGAFQLTPDGRLTVERLAATGMACDVAAMRADATITQMLSRPMTASLAGGASPVLRLASAGSAALVLTGQLTPEARYGAGTRIFLEVAAQAVACENPLTGASVCLQVRDRQFDAQGLATGAPSPWRPLFETIEGFTPEPGVRNVLRVMRYQRKPAPPGESALVYVLDLTVESEIVSR